MKTKVILFLFVLSSVLTYAVMSLTGQSIRLDESQSVWVAVKPIGELVEFVAEDVHVPLYFIMLHFWTVFFGTSTTAIRALSFVFYILTLPFLYSLVKNLSDKRVAVATVALFSLSPFVIWYSFEARMYTLLTLITTINHMFYLKFLKTSGSEGKLGYVISAILGTYTHYFFFFVLAGQFLYLLFRTSWVMFRKDETLHPASTSEKYKFKKNLKVYIGMAISVLVFFMPWATYVYSLEGASSTQPLIPNPTEYNVIQTFIYFLFGHQSPHIQGLLVSLWPLSAILLFLVFAKGDKIKVAYLDYFVVLTFVPLIMIFTISFIRPIFLARYLIFITPSLFLLLSLALLKRTGGFFSSSIPALLTIMFMFLINQTASSTNPAKENYLGVALFLNEKVTPSDVVAVSAPFTIYPIEYYYQGHARIDTIPAWSRFEQGAIPAFSVNNLSAQLLEYRKYYDRVFVVLSYDQGYEDDIREFLDNNYEIIERIKYSPELELTIYKLRYE